MSHGSGPLTRIPAVRRIFSRELPARRGDSYVVDDLVVQTVDMVSKMVDGMAASDAVASCGGFIGRQEAAAALELVSRMTRRTLRLPTDAGLPVHWLGAEEDRACRCLIRQTDNPLGRAGRLKHGIMNGDHRHFVVE